MSELLIDAAVLSETVLKNCSKCGHDKSHHIEGEGCTVEGCNCRSFE